MIASGVQISGAVMHATLCGPDVLLFAGAAVLDDFRERRTQMVSDQARVLTLQDEYWDIAFELPRPRAPDAVDKDRKRMAEIVEELGRLSADVGSRPADLPPEVG